jgi:hypothetical protein
MRPLSIHLVEQSLRLLEISGIEALSERGINRRKQTLGLIAAAPSLLLQVLVCQVGENTEINTVLCETLCILGHAQLFEPVANLLHRVTCSRVVA